MNERELNENIKVLVVGKTYHWRDARNRALCDESIYGDPVSLSRTTSWLCRECALVVERMTKGRI